MPRHVALDLLRALAVLLVIGRHLPPAEDDMPLLELWRCGGWVGVDLFFVLSGFLVAGLLFREHQRHGTLALGPFYLRRGLKIYPAFYFFLAVTLPLASLLRLPPAVTPRAIVAEGCFLQSYLRGAWNHTWSLAVEEHFYLLLPLGLLLLLRRPRPIGKLILGLAALLLAVRVATAWGRPFAAPRNLFPTHLRLDALGLGVAIAYYYHYHGAAFWHVLGPQRRRLLAAGVILLLPAFLCPLERSPWLYTVGLTLFALASAALVCGALLTRPGEGPLTRGLALVGAHSYSIYLWHMPVILWGPALLERWTGVRLGSAGQCAWALGGSVVVGVLMARLVELPVLHWRDRCFPSRASAPAAPLRAAA